MVTVQLRISSSFWSLFNYELRRERQGINITNDINGICKRHMVRIEIRSTTTQLSARVSVEYSKSIFTETKPATETFRFTFFRLFFRAKSPPFRLYRSQMGPTAKIKTRRTIPDRLLCQTTAMKRFLSINENETGKFELTIGVVQRMKFNGKCAVFESKLDRVNYL